MIRINLLPGPKGHKAKPQYDVRAQALLGCGAVVHYPGGMLVVFGLTR